MTGAPGEPSVEIARRELAARFRAEQIESAELDARLLVGAVLGLDLTAMIMAARRRLTSDESERLEQFARRRLAGEPVARILGVREFWGLPLRLSAATLVPRPDTETVVELALEMLGAAADPNQPWRIADLGTGSGAILLALLSELPRARGIGTDRSPAALRTARANAVDLGFSGRAQFVACDYAAALSGPFDLIVSNPPYVRTADIAGLAPEVRTHDPALALDGGSDGLEAYRALIPQAMRLLVHRGSLIVEVGHDQSSDVKGLMTDAGLTSGCSGRADLAGINRAVGGQKIAPIKPE